MRINSGATATITASVAGGEAPYTYEWRDQMNQVVSTEATLNVAPAYTYGYRLTVKSGDGQTATGKTKVLVTGETVAVFPPRHCAAMPKCSTCFTMLKRLA